MATLRQRVYKTIGGIPTLVDLLRTEQSINLTTGAETPSVLNVVQYGSDVTSQGLLSVVADLIANDKLIDAELNGINQLICEGVLNIPSYRFDIEIVDSPYEVTISRGKAKLHESDTEYNVFAVETETTFAVPDVVGIGWYRRDLINIVFKNTATGAPTTPYLEYVPGGELSYIPPRHTILDKSVTSTKSTYPLYSILFRNVAGVTTYVETDHAYLLAGFKDTTHVVHSEFFKKLNEGYYADFSDYRTFTDPDGNPLSVNVGVTAKPYITLADEYDLEAITSEDPTGKISLQEPDVTNYAEIANGDLLTFPFQFVETLNQYMSAQDVELREFIIAVDRATTPEEGLETHIYTAKYFVDATNNGIISITGVSVGGSQTTLDLSMNMSTFTKLTANQIQFDTPSGTVTAGEDFIFAISGEGLYQVARINSKPTNTRILIDNLPITFDTTTKILIFKHSTISLVGATIDSNFLSTKTEEEKMEYERQYPATTHTGIGGFKYSDTGALRGFVHGYKDISEGYDWNTTNQSFNINVTTGGVPQGVRTVYLNANCATMTAVVAHIAAALTTAGVTGVEVYDGGNGHVGIRTLASGTTESFVLTITPGADALKTLGIDAGTYSGILKPDIAEFYALPDNATNRLFYHMPDPPATFLGHIKIRMSFKLRLNYNQWYFARTSIYNRGVPYGEYGVRPKVVVLDPTWASTNSASINGYFEANIRTNAGLYPLSENGVNVFTLYDAYGDIGEDSLARSVAGYPLSYKLIAKNLNGSAYTRPTNPGEAYVDVVNGIISFVDLPFQDPVNLYGTYFYNSIVTGKLDTSKIIHEKTNGEVWNLQMLIERILNPTDTTKAGSTTFIVNIAPYTLDPERGGGDYDFAPGDVIRFDLTQNPNFGWCKADALETRTLGEVMVLERITDAQFQCIQVGYIDTIGELDISYTAIIVDEDNNALTENTIYYLSSERAGRLTKVRPEHAQPVLYTFQDKGGGVLDGVVVLYDNKYLQTIYTQKIQLQNQLASVVDRLNDTDAKVTELAFEVSYLTGKQAVTSDMFIETFLDNSQRVVSIETNSNNPLDIRNNNIWNLNWKEYNSAAFDFKQAFGKNRTQPWMLQMLDELDLSGIGQSTKQDICYDSTNGCYWHITNAGVNAVCELVRYSTNMMNNKVEVNGRWYLPAGGANTYWQSIVSDGSYLFIVLMGDGTGGISSKCYKVIINADGTLGKKTPTDYSKPSGGTLDMTNAPEVSATSTATHSWQSVVIWDSSNIMILRQNTTTAELVPLLRSTLASGSVSTITGLGFYVGGSVVGNRSMCLNGSDLYIRMDDTTDNKRLIYKFNINTDFISNMCVNSSGRFESTRGVDGNGGGICVGHHGDIVEVYSISGTACYNLTRRALKSVYWAENQVNAELVCASSLVGGSGITVPNVPVACMVEYTGGKYYYWTGDTAVGANEVDIYRFDVAAGTYKHARLIGASLTALRDLTYKQSSDTLYLLVNNATPAFSVYYGDLSDFVALMGNSYNVANTITLPPGGSPTWGTLATAFSTPTTELLYGICYNVDDDILYLLNAKTTGTGYKIETLSTSGATWVKDVYDLPSPTNTWVGVAYKNGFIYVSDWTNAATPNRIYALDKTLTNATKWWPWHAYQDSQWNFVASGTGCFDFRDNDIVRIDSNYIRFTRQKTLEDPSVLQLQNPWIGADNILYADSVSCVTKIIERHFKPSEFKDLRDCPNQYYMLVGYGTDGFSILHLDEFLCQKTTAGLDRYDIRKIIVQHYKKSTTGAYGAGNIIRTDAGNFGVVSIECEKELILVSLLGSTDAATTTAVLINLKAGTAMAICASGHTVKHTGMYYQGTLTERNDAKGYAGTVNTNLDIATHNMRVNAIRTFTKDDPSEYNNTNPITAIILGSDANGTDVFLIDWDVNNNRTPRAVWNNVFNSGTIGLASFLSPDGMVFVGNWAAAGELWRSFYIRPKYVWEADSDACWPYTAQGAAISNCSQGGWISVISPTSIVFKNAAGVWRHFLVVGTLESGGTGVTRISIVDVENQMFEDPFYYDWGGSRIVLGLDFFDGQIFCVLNNPTDNVFYTLVLKKQWYVDKLWTQFYRGWTAAYQQSISGEGIIPWTIAYDQRPLMVLNFRLAKTLGTDRSNSSSYSKNFGVMSTVNNAVPGGLNFLWVGARQNDGEYKSKEITLTKDPEQIFVNEHGIFE